MYDYRVPMGTHQKWLAYLIRWVMNFRLPAQTTILLRGRGSRKEHGNQNTIPLRYATHAAMYLIKRKDAEDMKLAFDRATRQVGRDGPIPILAPVVVDGGAIEKIWQENGMIMIPAREV